MPLQRCSLKGKPGWKFGAAGACFTGEGAEEKARQQGLAILRSMAMKAGHKDKKSIEDYMSKHSRELGKE